LGQFGILDDVREFEDDKAQLKAENEALRGQFAHIKKWVDQPIDPTSDITARQISDAVSRMCDDALLKATEDAPSD